MSEDRGSPPMPPKEWFTKYGCVGFYPERHPETPWVWVARKGDGYWYGKYGFCPWEVFQVIDRFAAEWQSKEGGGSFCKGYRTQEDAYAAILAAVEEAEYIRTMETK